MTSYVYLHGFASSPASSKAQYFRARLAERGLALHIPELDAGDFPNLTLSGQLRLLEAHLDGKPAVLLGSSLGGYLAALYAERHPEVERLVLLAPAFDFSRRWSERLGPQVMDQWQITGKLTVFHYGQGVESGLNYSLYEDSLSFSPYPAASQPMLIFHGIRDDIVPPTLSQRFVERHPQATLHLVDSGHELTNVLAEMWAATEPFLFL